MRRLQGLSSSGVSNGARSLTKNCSRSRVRVRQAVVSTLWKVRSKTLESIALREERKKDKEKR